MDAANLTMSIDDFNSSLTLADAPSIFKKSTLGVKGRKILAVSALIFKLLS